MGALNCKSRNRTCFYATTSDKFKLGQQTCVSVSTAADVNEADDEVGYMVLMRIIRRKHRKCLKLLIKSGADVNTVNYNGSTALCVRIGKNHRECVNFVMEAGVMAADGRKLLGDNSTKGAFYFRHEPLARLLMSGGADVNVSDDSGIPLTIAAHRGYVPFMKLLTDVGADVNAPDYQGRTPLICAARTRHFTCMNILIHAGADLNATDSDGYSALAASVGPGLKTPSMMTCTELLLQKGADVSKALREESMIYIDYVFSLEGFMLLYAAGVPLDENATIHGRHLVQENSTMRLQNICRGAIRKHLLELDSTSLFVRVPRLGLPRSMTSHLLYDVKLHLPIPEGEEDYLGTISL